MGVYLRKTVSAGPFRFNLSKSGIGVSAGVPGFRVGTGPRGNYVSAGRRGVYYRATLGGGRSGARAGPVARSGESGRYVVPPPIADVLLSDVTGVSAAELVSTGPGDLVDQLNAASRRVPVGPLLLIVLGCGGCRQARGRCFSAYPGDSNGGMALVARPCASCGRCVLRRQ